MKSKVKTKGYWSFLLLPLLISGCASPVVKYNPKDFVNPNKVVVKKIEVPALPETDVHATFGIGNDPLVVKAYNNYTKNGTLKTIHTAGWITYPYTPNSKPIMACQPLRLCVVQLEAGEQLNSVNIGDSTDWKVGEFLTGKAKTGTVSITVKPIREKIATDLIISTDKRTYNIGLVSKKGSKSSIIRFYYPEETLRNTVLRVQKKQHDNQENTVVSESSSSTKIDLRHVSFNYQISGSNPVWKPIRVFDDTSKTYIQLPTISTRFNLPVLYLSRHDKLEMVNYRYKSPYFIVDGLFQKAWLISGKGNHQVKVEINNNNISA